MSFHSFHPFHSRLVSDLQGFLDKTPRWLDPKFDGPRDYKRLYQMLKEDPELAAEIFPKKEPLFYLLAAQAPLEIIQEVYQMNPDVYWTSRINSIVDGYSPRDKRVVRHYPLDDAMYYRCDSEVVSFLAEKNKSAVRGNSMDLLFRNYFTENDYDKRQQPLKQHYGKEFVKPFKALYNANPLVFWHPVNGDRGSTDNLMSLMTNHRTPPPLLTWLATRLQPKDYGSATLIVKCEMVGRDKANQWIKSFQSFVPNLAPSWKELKFEGDSLFSFAPSLFFIQHFFSNVNVPPNLTIHFHNIRVFQNNLNFDSITQRGWTRSQVEEIKLTNFLMQVWDKNAVDNFLRNLQYVPNLKRLFLSNRRELERSLPITGALIELLESAQNLRLLVVKGETFQVNAEELLAAIHRCKPTTLVRYSKASIKKLSFYPKFIPIYNYEIAYHSSLYQNCPIIAAPNATATQVVDCLCSVKTNNSEGQTSPPVQTNNNAEERQSSSSASPSFLVESVFYELLREAPGLWVTHALVAAATAMGSCNEKKKRNQKKVRATERLVVNKKAKTEQQQHHPRVLRGTKLHSQTLLYKILAQRLFSFGGVASSLGDEKGSTKELSSCKVLALCLRQCYSGLLCDALVEPDPIKRKELENVVERFGALRLTSDHWILHKYCDNEDNNKNNNKEWYRACFVESSLPLQRPTDDLSAPVWFHHNLVRPSTITDALQCIPKELRPAFEQQQGCIVEASVCDDEKEKALQVLLFNSVELAVKMEAAFCLERLFGVYKTPNAFHWYEVQDLMKELNGRIPSNAKILDHHRCLRQQGR